MMRMNLFLVDIGYATVSSRKIMNYYFSERDYVPATTMRGAFLYPLVARGRKVEDLEGYFFTPGYPVKGGPTAPVHPLAPAVERKSREYAELRGVLRRWAGEEFSQLLRDERVKPRTGDLVRFRSSRGQENLYEGVSLEAFIQDNVAIGKESGSSKSNMLFSYEIKNYETVWVLSNLDLEVEEIQVGRGVTRGLGLGKVRRVREVELDLPGPGEVGYCLTPCVPSLFGREFFNPEEIRGDTDLYVSWYTWGKRAGLRPSFKVVKEGSIVRVKDVNWDRLMELWPAGLNVMVKIGDLEELLRRVQP